MKILITGATGLVGSHLLAELLREQPQPRIRVLVRPSSDRSSLDSNAVEIVLGDLRDPQSIKPAVQGVDAVFHCAAFVSDWASKEDMIQTNVEGLRHLLEASVAAGVGRFVFVSSLAVLGMGRQNDLDEEAPYVTTGDLYNYTKIEAERLVLEAGRRSAMAVMVLRPPYIYGPGDRQMLPRILSVLKAGKFAYIDGGKNPFSLVYVGNLVQGMILAMKKGGNGKIYHITDGVTITRRELINFIADNVGYPRPTKSIPLPVAKIACMIMEFVARQSRSKTPPLLNRFRLKFMSTHLTFNIDKAVTELGYQPLAQKQCLASTLAWYRESDNIYSQKV